MDLTPSTSLFADLDDIFVLVDDEETITDWNHATLDITGYDAASLETMRLEDWIAPEDTNRVTQAIAGLDAGETATLTVTIVTAEDEGAPFELKIHRLGTAGDGPQYAILGHEVTGPASADRHQHEILDRMSDGFFAVDEDWYVTYVNDYGKQIVGQAMGLEPEAELVGRHLWKEIPEAVETPFYEHYHEAMSTQEQVSFESYFEPLETWFDVRAYPSETGLSVYFSDITEQKQQRDALENRERVLREMHEIIADRDQSFEGKVNALFELGREELETDYGTLSKIQGDEYIFDIVSAADDSIEAGDVVPLSATNCEIAASSEETLVLGDVARDAPEETDRAGYVEWGIECYIGAPVLIDEDVYGTFCFYDTAARPEQFSEWEVTLVDLMSRWVSYELQRQIANDRLQQQNERLERFASIVSHDLRNPINVIDASLELIEESHESEHIDRCQRVIEQMDTLIDDLLTLAQAGDVIDDPKPIALSTVVERCLQNDMNQTVTIDVVSDRTVRADTARLQQLFENLIQNAIDHGGPEVTVSVGTIEGGFYVEDTGPGIENGDREKIFEYGYTTSSEGTGFGLAIVQEISDAHGWDITVTDSDSGGARFEFSGVSDPKRT